MSTVLYRLVSTSDDNERATIRRRADGSWFFKSEGSGGGSEGSTMTGREVERIRADVDSWAEPRGWRVLPACSRRRA